LARASETNPHATIPIQKIPRFIPHTNPTPPDESNTTGRVFFRIRMNPTSPDQSDRLQAPHNPSVVGSIPTGPTALKTTYQARDIVVTLFMSHSDLTTRSLTGFRRYAAP
jgi:hypothetical protein